MKQSSTKKQAGCPAFPGNELAPIGWCELSMGEWCRHVGCTRHDGRVVSEYQKKNRKAPR
jgi:hypothetical protein